MDKLNLQKGELLNLEKKGLEKLNIGLGWDITNGKEYDVDVFVFCYDINDNFLGKIFFRNKNDFGIHHCGDNLTGAGDGDDETIQVNLRQLDSRVKKIEVYANIFSAFSEHSETFNEIDNVFIRLYNADNQQELAKYNLSEKNRHFNAFHFADLIIGQEISFIVVGQFLNGSIAEIERKVKNNTPFHKKNKRINFLQKIFGLKI